MKKTKAKEEKLEVPKEKVTLFDVLDNISYYKENKWYEFKTVYNAFMVNKFLSMSGDTVFFANEMNKSQLEPELQYQFYLNSIPQKKRFFKYTKKLKDEDIVFVAEYFDVNRDRAKECLTLLTEENLSLMRKEFDVGGI
jgi:hypothetical protein